MEAGVERHGRHDDQRARQRPLHRDVPHRIVDAQRLHDPFEMEADRRPHTARAKLELRNVHVREYAGRAFIHA